MIAQKIIISYSMTKSKSGVSVTPSVTMEITLEDGENRTACMEQTMAYMREIVSKELSKALAALPAVS